MSGAEPLSVAAGLIADAGLKVTALFVLGGLTAQLLPGGSAAQRHAVWAATFATAPLLLVSAVQRGPTIALDAPWLAPIWLVGVLVAALPLVRGRVALWRLRRAARPDPHAPGVCTSVRPSDYAALLLSLASPASHRGALGAGATLVTRRVRAVLHPRSRSPRRGGVLALALALGAGVSSTVGALPAWSHPPTPLTCTPEPSP